MSALYRSSRQGSCRRLPLAPTAGLLALGSLALLSAPAAMAGSPYAPPALLGDATSGDLGDAGNHLIQGDDPDPRDETGRTPLILATQHHNAAMAKLLLDNKAAVNKTDGQGKTALFYAAEQGDVDVIDVLLHAGAKVDLDAKGVTPLMAAARAGQDDAVERLLAGGADPSRTDYSGRDALDWARDSRNQHVMQILKTAAKR